MKMRCLQCGRQFEAEVIKGVLTCPYCHTHYEMTPVIEETQPVETQPAVKLYDLQETASIKSNEVSEVEVVNVDVVENTEPSEPEEIDPKKATPKKKK